MHGAELQNADANAYVITLSEHKLQLTFIVKNCGSFFTMA